MLGLCIWSWQVFCRPLQWGTVLAVCRMIWSTSLACQKSTYWVLHCIQAGQPSRVGEAMLEAVVSAFAQLRLSWPADDPAAAATAQDQKLCILRGWCDCFAIVSSHQRLKLLSFPQALLDGELKWAVAVACAGMLSLPHQLWRTPILVVLGSIALTYKQFLSKFASNEQH